MDWLKSEMGGGKKQVWGHIVGGIYDITWKIPWTEEPGGLKSMELQGVRHD